VGPPPREIGGLEVVLYSPIDERHTPSGACRHVVGGVPWGPAAGLAICRYEGETSFYLFGCDANWSGVTDTWHETLEEAMSQAESEYPGVSQTWQRSV
jgi:hypothetical protein